MSDPLPLLRRAALAEAVSFLVLLGIAMPLKYAFAMPIAVTIVGSLHGVLFVAVVWLLLRARTERGWPNGRIALLFAASLVPFWPFFLDGRVRAWIAATPPVGS